MIVVVLLGRVPGSRLPARFRESAIDALGLLVLLIGIQMAMGAELFATGGVMMLGLGMQLRDLKSIRVANSVPDLVIAPVLVALAGVVQR